MEYNKYMGLITKKVCEVGSRKRFRDFQELHGEANLIYCKCLKTFDPERAGFSTYLTMKLNFGLIDYINKEKKLSCESLEGNPDPIYVKHNFADLLQSIDGMDIFQSLIHLPEYFDDKKINKEELKKYLRIRKWSWKRIRNGMKDIRQAIISI